MTERSHDLLPDAAREHLTPAFAGDARRRPQPRLKLMLVFGTRPELIKVLPIIREIERRSSIELVTVMTSQHTDLVRPLIDLWSVRIDHDLDVMTRSQSLNDIVSRVMGRIDGLIQDVSPDVVMVQGDTSSALAATMAAWHRKIPVAHIEAGLRTQDIASPFPEEANRRLIGRLATFHFAPTARNVAALLADGVPRKDVYLTGNTIVDAIGLIRGQQPPSQRIADLICGLEGQRIIVLTTHRREGFGTVLQDRLRVIRRFVEARPDVSVIFPVHPNPQVKDVAIRELGGVDRIHLLDALAYPDFLHCLAASWVILSDSGGIQEEAPTLGKPLLILRPETERPEVVSCGIARLVGQSVERLQAELQELEQPGAWNTKVHEIANPFGTGDSARRIVSTLLRWKARRPQPVEAELVS